MSVGSELGGVPLSAPLDCTHSAACPGQLACQIIKNLCIDDTYSVLWTEEHLNIHIFKIVLKVKMRLLSLNVHLEPTWEKIE